MALLLVLLKAALVSAGSPRSSSLRPLAGPPPLPSAGCGTPMKWPAGTPNLITLPIDDPLLFNPFREMFVYTPVGYDNSVPLPVVYSFHGYYSDAATKMTDDHFMWKIEDDLKAKAEQGFIVVWGQGMGDCAKGGVTNCYATDARTWNIWGQSESPGPRGHTCDQHRSRFGRYGCYTSCRIRANDSEISACFKDGGKNSTTPGYDHCHASTCANDTLYADVMMRTVESTLCVDKRRQYVTGMSVGAMMAYWLAVHFSDRFAAALPVAGSALVGFWQSPKFPMPLMDVHGTDDKTIPANYSNGFVGHGENASSQPLKVPGCWSDSAFSDCGFSDDGFYYTSNYNITHGVATSNKCSCVGYGADCGVKNFRTVYSETDVGDTAKWTCFESFGSCGMHPVVRCTWAGKHYLPIHGHARGVNTTMQEAKRFFANVAWEFLSKFAIEPGSDKERSLLGLEPI